MNDMIHLSPLHQLRQMQYEVDRLFDGLLPHKNGKDKADTAVWSPRADLAENDDAYLIMLDLPGTSKKDVTINYQEGTLNVSGECSRRRRDDANVVYAERYTGYFYRDFKLPDTVNASKIEATYQNGVLKIMVPKAEVSKPFRIKVK